MALFQFLLALTLLMFYYLLVRIKAYPRFYQPPAQPAKAAVVNPEFACRLIAKLVTASSLTRRWREPPDFWEDKNPGSKRGCGGAVEN